MRKFFLRRFLFILITACSALNVRAQVNIPHFVFSGMQYLSEGKFTEAIRNLNVVIYNAPEMYEPWFYRGIAKYNLGDYKGSEADFNRCLEIHPLFSPALHYRAITRDRLRDVTKAMKDYAAALRIDPLNPDIYVNRGISRFQNKDYRLALADLDSALRLDKDHSLAYLMRGMVRNALKDVKGALADLDKATHLNIFYTEGYIRRGQIRYDSADYIGAIDDFNTALRIEPNDPAVYFSRAMAYNKLDKSDLMFDDMNKVLELDPHNSLTLYNRALIFSERKEYKRALEDYDQVLRLSPDNVLATFNRAIIKHITKDYKGAIEDYSRAITLFPDFAKAWMNRSDAWRQLGNEKEALVDYNKAKLILHNIESSGDSTLANYADSAYLARIIEFEADFRNTSAVDGRIQYQPVYVDLERNFFITYLYNDSVYVKQKRGAYWVSAMTEFNRQNAYRLNFGLTNRENTLTAEEVSKYIGSVDSSSRMNPTDPLAYFFIGVLNGMIQNYNSAITAYDKAIDLDPGFAFAYLNRANTRLQVIEETTGENDYINTISIGNSTPVKAQAGNDDQSQAYIRVLEDYNKVIQMNPELSFAWFNRANVKTRQGKYQDALVDYNRAIDLNDKLAEAHFNRALILIFLKQNDVACRDLSRAGELGLVNAYNLIKRYCNRSE
ncbi:MAG TPA: hypothetical protein DCR43_06740 [Bacteroidales bacterium]|nr:MAG: hypothetical protein A2X11_16215 [Bacteroidetes bacterium GWE2_42_24]OFY29185.1 MAG: hypothetical protein A2X09_05620 [Bacteroidetes bacterium GWF2_43_11]PKP25099.1 MAG: hypothetical protein CVU06_04400 [Bacteroidetes bacterium HGW-Bacteroidetes-22]HAQ65532.1 hypothetical protein [Bacteroidales bacterium]HBZ66834.1 hypothetical protein [Bacteroidales bacterium]